MGQGDPSRQHQTRVIPGSSRQSVGSRALANLFWLRSVRRSKLTFTYLTTLETAEKLDLPKGHGRG
jgi:hypothetical protein